jgi:hypothetical protein
MAAFPLLWQFLFYSPCTEFNPSNSPWNVDLIGLLTIPSTLLPEKGRSPRVRKADAPRCGQADVSPKTEVGLKGQALLLSGDTQHLTALWAWDETPIKCPRKLCVESSQSTWVHSLTPLDENSKAWGAETHSKSSVQLGLEFRAPACPDYGWVHQTGPKEVKTIVILDKIQGLEAFFNGHWAHLAASRLKCTQRNSNRSFWAFSLSL